MKYLENSELRLRALEPTDIELLYLWENDSLLWEVSYTQTPYSRHILKCYLDTVHKDIYEQKQLRLVIEIKDGTMAVPVGLIDLFDIDFAHARAGVGVLIYSAEDRGKGYATAALGLLIHYSFKILGLHQLYCNIGVSNTASIKLFENAGFERIGVKKEWRKTPEGWQDELLLQRVSK